MSDISQGPGWWQASDGKWYPPQPGPLAAPLPVYQPARSTGMNGCLIAFLVVLGVGAVGLIVTVIVAAVAVDNVDEQIADEEAREGQDVEVTGCEVGEFGNLTATLQVTNNSSEPSTYLIEVVFETRNGSRQIDSGIVSVNELRPGQSTEVDAVGTAIPPPDPPPGFTCDVADVQRFAS